MSQQTYNDLIDAAKNTNAIQDDTDKLVESRYAAVIASAKRARQLIAGAKPMVAGAAGKKPLSVAIDELYQGQIKILAPEEETEETAEAVQTEAAVEETEAVAEAETEEN